MPTRSCAGCAATPDRGRRQTSPIRHPRNPDNAHARVLSSGILAIGAAVVVVWVWPGVVSGPARPGLASATLAQRLSRHAIPASARWRGYDEAPSRAVVQPVRVLAVTGDVTQPQALTPAGSGATTTLTYSPGAMPPSLVLDYGREVGGTPTFDIAGRSDTTISATFSEKLANLGQDGATSDALFKSGTAQRTDLFRASGPGVTKASVIQGGERYERLTLTSPGTVTVRSAGINFTPARETPALMRGHFLSSDRLLNRIWYAGAYTLNLNQLTPGTAILNGAVNRLHLIMDGAKRDRADWSGDQLIADLTDYYVSDPVYARDSEALLLDHPASTAGELTPARANMSQPGPLPGVCTPNPSVVDRCLTWSATYSMAVIAALYNYYLYTGDRAFVRAHWPAVVRQMRWDAAQVGQDGLFAVGAVDDFDWNIEHVTGELTYVNAVYVEALRAAARVALALGHAALARTWSTAAAAVSDAVNRDLWDPKTGVYDASTSERGAVIQDANVTAILAGIASPTRARRIASVMQRALRGPHGPLSVSSPVPTGYTQDISPYMGGFNVLADFAVGDQAAALSVIRQEWGFMVSNDPGGVDWERIELTTDAAVGAPGDSSAHAWSTAPTPALSQYVLGVTPATPGFSSWTVAPQPEGLRWAQGAIPTPRGPIDVRWRRTSDDAAFVLTVRAPRGTSGTVRIPVADGATAIACNGRIVWRDGRPTRGARVHRLGAGVALTQSGASATYAAVG
jgi:Bacterial alpha-L-rhamnosidase C-terminal domain/Bacterial alpha-L-rhamnosidase 6 hairpin glycosidase domain